MKQQIRRLPVVVALLAVASLTLASCAPAPVPTPGLVLVTMPPATPAPTPATDAEKVLLVIASEAEAVRQQDIDALEALWLADGKVVDARNTPDDPTDDRVWQGWPEIRERYVKDVFPYVAAPADVPRPRTSTPLVRVDAGKAEVTVPGADGHTPQDRWLLQRDGSTWKIASLTFNLTPRQ